MPLPRRPAYWPDNGYMPFHCSELFGAWKGHSVMLSVYQNRPVARLINIRHHALLSLFPTISVASSNSHYTSGYLWSFLGLDYGRCLHSTYLRKEVRTVGPMSSSPALPLRSHPHSNCLSLSLIIPPPRPLRRYSTSRLVHQYPGYAAHSRLSSVDADESAIETAVSGSPLPTLHPQPACTPPVHGIPYMSRNTPPRMDHT